MATLKVIKRAQLIEDQNIEFRSFLKNHADCDELDEQFLNLHTELFADYDCCKCTNCCKAYSTLLDDDEVKRIAAFLGMTESDFYAKYLKNASGSSDKPYKIREKPCPFLKADGCCRIQDCKPDECRDYPYTDKADRLASMYSILESAEVCPVVFEMLERLKVIYQFQAGSDPLLSGEETSKIVQPIARVQFEQAPITADVVAVKAAAHKTGRNDPCPCGSGKKYKKCCGFTR